MSQIEAGLLLGISNATISSYERGRTEPDLETLTRISGTYRCSLAYLLGHRNDVEFPSPPADWRRDVEDSLRQAGWPEARIRKALRLLELEAEEFEQG